MSAGQVLPTTALAGAAYRLGAQDIYRQRNSTRRSPDKPHGCWVLRPEFTVNSGIDLTVNFRRELSATFFLKYRQIEGHPSDRSR